MTVEDLKKLDPKRTMVLAVTDEVGGTREYVLKLDKVTKGALRC